MKQLNFCFYQYLLIYIQSSLNITADINKNIKKLIIKNFKNLMTVFILIQVNYSQSKENSKY